MNILRRYWVWIGRMHRSKGFGIQSPKDYGFVTEVINEHYPYYAYSKIKTKDWKTKKLGQLYLRLANWRQPEWMELDEYQEWWEAGKNNITSNASPFRKGGSRTIELARMDVAGDWEKMATRCDSKSVVVVEDIYRDWQRWHSIEQDSRVGTTFDLYYCGIVWFDKERFGHHYKVNF